MYKLEKLVKKCETNDDGEIDNFNNSCCTVLLDKEYTGTQSTVQGIDPDERHSNGWLSPIQLACSHHCSSDGKTVGMFFGSLCTFNLIDSYWGWSEEKYSQLLKFAVPVTNDHILWKSLWSGDGIPYLVVFPGSKPLGNRCVEGNRLVQTTVASSAISAHLSNFTKKVKARFRPSLRVLIVFSPDGQWHSILWFFWSTISSLKGKITFELRRMFCFSNLWVTMTMLIIEFLLDFYKLVMEIEAAHCSLISV